MFLRFIVAVSASETVKVSQCHVTAERTSQRNLLIPDLHHKIGVVDESWVVHKLLIGHSLFQKCICEGNRGEGGADIRDVPFRGVGSLSTHSLTSVFQLYRQLSQGACPGAAASSGDGACAEVK